MERGINMGNITPFKMDIRKESRRLLITHRYFIRKFIQVYQSCSSEWHMLDRQRRKLKEHNISVHLIDRRLEVLRTKMDELINDIADCGETCFSMFDVWQESGATLHDLADLIGIRYEDVVKEVGPDRLNAPFSSLMYVGTLDYKHNNDDFLMWETDGPYTQALREFVLREMLHNRELKEKTNEALFECFPELRAAAFQVATNVEGETVFFDMNGNEKIFEEGEI